MDCPEKVGRRPDVIHEHNVTLLAVPGVETCSIYPGMLGGVTIYSECYCGYNAVIARGDDDIDIVKTVEHQILVSLWCIAPNAFAVTRESAQQQRKIALQAALAKGTCRNQLQPWQRKYLVNVSSYTGSQHQQQRQF